MPSLLDLFRLNADAVKQTPARLQNLPSPPPRAPEWDIRSGLPEPGLGQVTPEEWLPPGAGMKLAALAKGLAGKAAIAGTFIGAKHPSWMADAAEEALRLKAQGVDPREIWARTRTFTEHPGVPAVQEISDARASINKAALRQPLSDAPDYLIRRNPNITNEELYDHPNLFRGYRKLAEGKGSYTQANDVLPAGEFWPRDNRVTVNAQNLRQGKGLFAHEMQHGVQHVEGWPTGGNSKSMLVDPQTRPAAQAMAAEFEAAGMAPADAVEKAAYETYRRLAGEAQAEAARARANFTDSQLTAKYPGDYYPVPLKDLLVRRGTGNQAADVAEARFPVMNEARLDRLLGDSGYSMNDKAKYGLTTVDPKTFLGATTTPIGYSSTARINQEAGRFDPFKFMNESQHPYLDLSLDPVPLIEGHEGRHRLASLAQFADRVPIVAKQTGSPGLRPDKFSEMANRTYGGQFPRSEDIPIGDITPLSYSTPYADLEKYLTNVDVPLKDIGISLKPVGPNVPREDLKAYRQSIPKGKIPPPKPKE